MTRETARIKVEQLDNYLSRTCQDYGERDHEAMMMAIKALEQEPTTKNDLAVDCISRDDVRNVMQELWGTSGELMDRLMALPSVTPQPCEDVVSRQAVLDLINADWKYEGLETEINNLPSVTPQEPRKGHWIDTDEWRETVDGFEQWGYFRKCSKCGYVFKFLEIDNYCPNCGAKMVESQEK